MQYPKYIQFFDIVKEGFVEEVYTWWALYVKRARDNCEDILIGIIKKKGT